MPYVKQEDRPRLDKVVAAMKDAGVKVDGDLNYILYAFMIRHIKPSYNNYKNYRAELKECAKEVWRRKMVPYENTKIDENGDIFELPEIQHVR